MVRSMFGTRMMWMAAGLLIGAALISLIPHNTLHAVATDRQDTFAICTGRITDETEGVFTLDFLTGALTGAVINRNTQKFSLTYSANSLVDLKLEQGKTPKFVLVTGDAEIAPRGVKQFGRSIIYVAELTSGNMCAYAIPFNPQWLNSTAAPPPGQALELLFSGPFRAAAAR